MARLGQDEVRTLRPLLGANPTCPSERLYVIRSTSKRKVLLAHPPRVSSNRSERNGDDPALRFPRAQVTEGAKLLLHLGGYDTLDRIDQIL